MRPWNWLGISIPSPPGRRCRRLEADGDVDGALAVLREDLPDAGAYAGVTAFLERHGRLREAFANAEAGLRAHPDDERLQADMLRCYERDGWADEALALRRKRFERWPSVEGYRDLLRAGAAAGRDADALRTELRAWLAAREQQVAPHIRARTGEAGTGVTLRAEVLDDAVKRCHDPLTHERLHAWHAALFPTGYSGMTKIRVGGYREHGEPMQIVSGRVGREKVHYEAPPSARVPDEMDRLLQWFNAAAEPDTLVRAALAHLRFETIHPFEDGNGRLGRVLVDLLLARDSGETSRLFRTSQRLLDRRRDYYANLERAQHGGPDVTDWVCWFVEQMQATCEEASTVVDHTLVKTRFWLDHGNKTLSERQRKVMNLLLDAGPGGFDAGMSTKKYENLSSTSRATASRELIDLEAMGLLEQVGAGRSTRYYVALPGWGAAANMSKD